jgi:hypothetical protein
MSPQCTRDLSLGGYGLVALSFVGIEVVGPVTTLHLGAGLLGLMVVGSLASALWARLRADRSADAATRAPLSEHPLQTGGVKPLPIP